MFKKINLSKDVINVNNLAFAKAIYSTEIFAISLDGKIINSTNINNELLIFQGRGSLTNKFEPLGIGYSIKSTFANVSIYVKNIPNKIFDLNRHLASYEDISSEGVDSFKDEVLENIGWHSIEFGISYRQLVEYLEEFGNGLLIYSETEEPYSFNGMAFIKNEEIEHNRTILQEFATKEIKQKLINNFGEWRKYGFSNEQIKALEYFGINIPD